MAIKQSYRLPLKTERSRLNDNGTVLRLENQTLIYIKSPLTFSRFAIIASKKVSPLATVRNHLKRSISSILQEEVAKIPSIDLIIIPKPNAVNLTFQKLKEEIQLGLKKIYSS